MHIGSIDYDEITGVEGKLEKIARAADHQQITNALQGIRVGNGGEYRQHGKGKEVPQDKPTHSCLRGHEDHTREREKKGLKTGHHKPYKQHGNT